MTVELAEKRCGTCGVVKSLADFHRNSRSRDGRAYNCRDCAVAKKNESNERVRARIGDERFKEIQRARVAQHRKRTGNAKGREYEAAKTAALRVLRDRHRKEYEHLLLLARRGELNEQVAS